MRLITILLLALSIFSVFSKVETSPDNKISSNSQGTIETPNKSLHIDSYKSSLFAGKNKNRSPNWEGD